MHSFSHLQTHMIGIYTYFVLPSFHSGGSVSLPIKGQSHSPSRACPYSHNPVSVLPFPAKLLMRGRLTYSVSLFSPSIHCLSHSSLASNLLKPLKPQVKSQTISICQNYWTTLSSSQMAVQWHQTQLTTVFCSKTLDFWFPLNSTAPPPQSACRYLLLQLHKWWSSSEFTHSTLFHGLLQSTFIHYQFYKYDMCSAVSLTYISSSEKLVA